MDNGRWNGVFMQFEDGVLAYGFKRDDAWIGRYRVIDQFNNYTNLVESEKGGGRCSGTKYRSSVQMTYSGGMM